MKQLIEFLSGWLKEPVLKPQTEGKPEDQTNTKHRRGKHET